NHLVIAFSYWLRTSSYLLLLPALTYLAQNQQNYRQVHYSFVASALILTILGFLQVIFFGQLAAARPALFMLSGSGWDPDEGRLVSTWFDPNFFGAWVNIALLYCGSYFFLSTKRLHKLFFLGLTIALGLTGILTQSRSSFI